MSDENKKPKKDDWGMTTPNLHFGKEKGRDNFSENFAAPPKSAKQSRMDDWEMIPPNLNNLNGQPFSSDLDKSAPNIKIPKNVRQDETTPMSNQPSAEDWGMTVQNVSVSSEEKPSDWEVNVPPPFKNLKQEKKSEWSMPEPVFRHSEGEDLEEVAKRTAVFNLKDVEDFGETTSDFDFSEVSPPEPFKPIAPNINLQPQPYISDSLPADKIALESKPPVHPSNDKVIFIVVGLFLLLLFASVVLFGIYLLLRSNS